VIPACRAGANARFRFNGAGQAIRFCSQSRTGISHTVLFIGQLVSYSMFLHAEHHLFPAVPTAHLKELARRIDAAMPGRNQQEVLRFGGGAQNTMI